MKKKVLGSILLLFVCTITVFNLNIKKQVNASEVTLANIEALAYGEDLPPVIITCGQYQGHCWIPGQIYKMCGEYTYLECKWTGLERDECYKPC